MTLRTCLWCREWFKPLAGLAERFCQPECGRSAYFHRLLCETPETEVEGRSVPDWTTDEEAITFITLATEFMSVKAEVIVGLRPYLELDDEQQREGEATGRPVWRYMDHAEEEMRSRWIALRELTDDWGDYV